MELKPISEIRIRKIDGSWPMADGIREKVDAHWRRQVEANPHLWNGRVLGTVAPGWPGGIRLDGEMISGNAVEGDFASYLAWRDWGFPEIGIRNLFGSALVKSADGAFIYGVMAATTANAGKIYPPGGSLEPSDCDAEGRVQVVASIERELFEETGLDAADAVCEGMIAAFDGPRVSIGRVLRFDAPADEIVAEVMRNLELQQERELERVVALTPDRLSSAGGLMPYARAFVEKLAG